MVDMLGNILEVGHVIAYPSQETMIVSMIIGFEYHNQRSVIIAKRFYDKGNTLSNGESSIVRTDRVIRVSNFPSNYMHTMTKYWSE